MIDANPASSTMNSYCDLTFADEYFSLRFGAEAWADFEEAKKEALLVRATNKLDTFKYGGLKTSRTQPLMWPRQGIYDDEGNPYPQSVVPVKVKAATCEMAFWYWTEDDRFISDTDAGQIESYSAGPLSVKAKAGANDFPKIVTDMLSSIGEGTLLLGSVSGARTMQIRL